MIARVKYPESDVACTVSKLIQAYVCRAKGNGKKKGTEKKRKEKLELLHYTNVETRTR